MEKSHSECEKKDGKTSYLDMDEVAEGLGGFGRFQLLMYILGCLPALWTSTQAVGSSFTAYQPDYRCRIPGCDVGDTPEYHPNEAWINVTIPYENEMLSQCNVYKYKVTTEADPPNTCTAERLTASTSACSEWVYDHSEFKSTIVTDFDLTCEDEWFKPLTTSLYMVGLLIGAPAWGFFSDKFGRKLCLVVSTTSAGIVGIVVGLMPERVSYTCMIVLNGIVNIGIFQTCFLLSMEFVGLKYRMALGIHANTWYAVGEASVAFYAYLIRKWNILQIVMAAPMCLCVSYYWLMSESPRWLLSQGRWQEAREILLKAARMNKLELPERLLPNENTTIAEENATEKVSMKTAMKDLIILRMILVMCYLWFASAFSYYALSMNSSNLGGNVYLNFVLAMLVEFPAYFLLQIFLNRLGRRLCNFICFLLAGVFCIAAGFIPEDIHWLTITLSLLGKMFISGNFAIAYMFTAELFPTVIRTTTIGTCSLFSRLGSIISPFIADLGDKNAAIPFIICGAVALLGAILSLDLPETNGAKLPETLEDAKHLKRVSGGCLSIKTKVQV